MTVEKINVGEHVSVICICIYFCSECVYLLGGGPGLSVGACVHVCWWRWMLLRNRMEWGSVELKDGRKGWSKHLEVTQVDSGLVCSLYQWGPRPWTLGVYLSSWGTAAHYSPPIMPHRAPFLCLNWAAVCTPMNYSIYLPRCSEVCLEKQLQTPEMPTCAFAHLRKPRRASLNQLFLFDSDPSGSWSSHIPSNFTSS